MINYALAIATVVAMTMTNIICTILASTVVSTGFSCAITFAILFLALAFFTVASLLLILFCCTLRFYFHYLSGLFDRAKVVVIIRTTIARAIRRTHFSSRKALAVHLQAFSFFAGATSFFLFDVGSRGYSLMVSML